LFAGQAEQDAHQQGNQGDKGQPFDALVGVQKDGAHGHGAFPSAELLLCIILGFEDGQSFIGTEVHRSRSTVTSGLAGWPRRTLARRFSTDPNCKSERLRLIAVSSL
jgi:hypothetical protein